MARLHYSPEQREAADLARREAVDQLHRDLTDKLATFDDRGAWEQWLRFASTFHTYSFSNTCLIYLARPDATLVAGYRAWQAKGHQVRRGEQAIKIFAPITRNVPLEDANGNPLLDEHGQPRHRRELVGAKLASVFDASQVDPPPVSRPRPQLLIGQAPPGLWDALADFVAGEGFTLTRGDCGAANGWTDFTTRQIRVRADVDEAQAVKTLAHEASHTITMSPADIAAYSSLTCRGISEVIAESVSFIVTQAHGLDAGQYTFNYVAGWATQAAQSEPGASSIDQVVKSTGDRVIAAANRILSHTQPDLGPANDPAAAAVGVDLVPSTTVSWETVSTQASSRSEADRRIASPHSRTRAAAIAAR